MTTEKILQEKPLPSSNFASDKQIEILKACAVYYAKNQKGSTYKDIASILTYDKNNVSGSLKFWKEVGMLVSDKGAHVPSQLTIDFNRRIQDGQIDDAWSIFRQAIEGSWFADQLKMKFQLKSTITKEELIKLLSVSSGAAPDDKNKQKSISILISLLEDSKTIIKSEDGTVYSLKSESQKIVRELIVDETKEMIQVKINDEVYAIASETIKDFVIANGKRINSTVQKIG